MAKYAHRGICHTPCYWKETLWIVGDVYEGDDPPNKHFSSDGEKDPEAPPPDAGSDPRSNLQLRKDLKEHPYNFTAPKSWTRKQMWAKFHEVDRALELDALTAKDSERRALCGFIGKTHAGKLAHQKRCAKCQQIFEEAQNEEETVNGESSEHM